MATPSRLLFVNLPVADLPASIAFFTKLGFTFNPQFTDETTTCMIVSEQAYFMLMVKPRFAEFATRPVADAASTTEALFCVSAESREGVDTLADAALAAGGTPAKEPMDQGFMYGRSFNDLDGHHWEVMWMDPAVVAGDEHPAAAESAA